jgi:hypothetical protein
VLANEPKSEPKSGFRPSDSATFPNPQMKEAAVLQRLLSTNEILKQLKRRSHDANGRR